VASATLASLATSYLSEASRSKSTCDRSKFALRRVRDRGSAQPAPVARQTVHDPLGLGYCPGRRRGLRGTLQPFQRFLSGGRIRPSGPCGEYKGAFSRCEYILPYDQHCAVCLCWGCDNQPTHKTTRDFHKVIGSIHIVHY
jgi:hypothetical protein